MPCAVCVFELAPCSMARQDGGAGLACRPWVQALVQALVQANSGGVRCSEIALQRHRPKHLFTDPTIC
ncbi:protein of unknown function [Paraburkholderia kururiensis]